MLSQAFLRIVEVVDDDHMCLGVAVELVKRVGRLMSRSQTKVKVKVTTSTLTLWD